jgi:hypothetical protein
MSTIRLRSNIDIYNVGVNINFRTVQTSHVTQFLSAKKTNLLVQYRTYALIIVAMSRDKQTPSADKVHTY